MSIVWWILGVAAAVGFMYLTMAAWRGVGIPALYPGRADPATTPSEAHERFAALSAIDADECVDPCRGILLEPNGPALATFVCFHGFTHCPDQFRPVGEVLRSCGFRVLVTRQPRHGLPDRLTKSLRDLEPIELIDSVDRTIDIAAGFGGPVYVLGLSGGGIQAAWAAATRVEVAHTLVISPATSPGWASVPVVRLFVRFRSLLPETYIWWDPRTKTERVQSVHEYPGFPLPGIIPLLHMAIELGDRRIEVNHRVRRAILLTNPNDHAVSRHAARWMMARAFGGHAADLRELRLAGDLRWGHDFIDVAAEHHGEPSQVAEIVLAAFGLVDDPTAGGLLVEPGDQL